MFDSQECQVLYNLGVTKFTNGSFDEAKEIFHTLSFAAPKNYIYMKSYAGALHANKELVQAAKEYYAIYKANKTENLDCLYYVSIVLFELKKYSLAKTQFEVFIEFATRKTKYQMLVNKASTYLKLIHTVQTKNNVK